MGRDGNFRDVIGEAYEGDEFGKKCEHVVHGFMDFLTQLTGAETGELTSRVQEGVTRVVEGEFHTTREYRASVTVRGPNGEEWVLRVAATPDR